MLREGPQKPVGGWPFDLRAFSMLMKRRFPPFFRLLVANIASSAFRRYGQGAGYCNAGAGAFRGSLQTNEIGSMRP